MATREEEKRVTQPSSAPTSKTTAGFVGGALATIVIVLAGMIFNVTFPAGFEGAVAVVFGFLMAYVTKEKVQVE